MGPRGPRSTLLSPQDFRINTSNQQSRTSRLSSHRAGGRSRNSWLPPVNLSEAPQSPSVIDGASSHYLDNHSPSPAAGDSQSGLVGSLDRNPSGQRGYNETPTGDQSPSSQDYLHEGIVSMGHSSREHDEVSSHSGTADFQGYRSNGKGQSADGVLPDEMIGKDIISDFQSPT